MNKIAASIASLGVAFAAQPVSANTIASLTAVPAQAAVGQTVTVTVTRSGFVNCSASLNYGDGSPPEAFILTASPKILTHAFSSAGTYSIAANAGSGAVPCQGGAQDSVTVSGGGAGRATAGKAPDRTLKPVSPGGKRSKAERYEKKPLQNLFETRMLSMNDSVVRVLACGDDANSNKCNNAGSEAGDCVAGIPFTAGPGGAPATILGSHANCGTIGDDTGTDRYEIKLKNGWFINRVVEKDVHGTSSDDTASISSVPTGQGVSETVISVDWVASPHDSVSYWLRIEAKGPTGTSPL